MSGVVPQVSSQVSRSTGEVRPDTVTVRTPPELSILLAPSTSAVHTSLPPRVTLSRVRPSTSSSRACDAPTAIGPSPTPARTDCCAVVEGAAGVDDDGVDFTDEDVAAALVAGTVGEPDVPGAGEVDLVASSPADVAAVLVGVEADLLGVGLDGVGLVGVDLGGVVACSDLSGEASSAASSREVSSSPSGRSPRRSASSSKSAPKIEGLGPVANGMTPGSQSF